MLLRGRINTSSLAVAAGLLLMGFAQPASAQERLPWGPTEPPRLITPHTPSKIAEAEPRYDNGGYGAPARDPRWEAQRGPGGYAPPYPRTPPPAAQPYPPAAQPAPYAQPPYPAPPPRTRAGRYGEPYYQPPAYQPPPRSYEPPPHAHRPEPGTYSSSEILRAGHGFFGSVSKGLASVIEYAFQRSGRPNGYILGESAGGAFIAGLRYGEGMLHTKDAGRHKVYWQGPSVGYDFGGEGSKVMILVYNLRHPSEIYARFGGVAGSAYLVGGVGITYLAHNHVVMAPIRSGLGLRFGANVGYLKYTRRPTWNPF